VGLVGATVGRGLARLAEVTGRPDYRAAAAKVVRTLVERAKSVLGAVATPVGLRDQGRWVGEFLLALDEVGVVPW
jgi:hypothetical protein